MDKNEIQKLVNRVSHIYLIYSIIIGILGAGAFLCFMHWEINTSLLVVTSGALLTFIGIFYSLTILPGEEEKNQLFLKLMNDIKNDIEVFFNDVNKKTPIEETEIIKQTTDKEKEAIFSQIKTIIRISRHIRLILLISAISLILSMFFALFSGTTVSTAEILSTISYFFFVVGGVGSLLIICNWYITHGVSMQIKYHEI